MLNSTFIQAHIAVDAEAPTNPINKIKYNNIYYYVSWDLRFSQPWLRRMPSSGMWRRADLVWTDVPPKRRLPFIHSSMALQPFVGPWPLRQFRNLFLLLGRVITRPRSPTDCLRFGKKPKWNGEFHGGRPRPTGAVVPMKKNTLLS
jgi:hypothetical protein